MKELLSVQNCRKGKGLKASIEGRFSAIFCEKIDLI